MIKNVLFAVLVLLSGCATSYKFETALYDKIPKKYGDVGVVVNEGVVYHDAYYRDLTPVFTQEALWESGLFNQLQLNTPHLSKQIKVKIFGKNEGSVGAEMSKLMVGAATLFLLPTQSDMIYIAEFTIECRGSAIKTLSYEQPLTKTHFIGVDPQSYEKKFIKSSVSKFLRDIQDTEALSQDC